MQHKLVSVIMAVYNAEKYVSEAIDSILKQTYTNFEFIIVDDGSTDHSWNILQSYANQDSRIRLFRNKINSKLPKTLNFALEQARGEFVARMDADDIALPQRFAKQVAFLESNPEVSVCGTWATAFLDDINKPVQYMHRYTTSELIRVQMYLFGCEINNPSSMIRMNVFKDGIHYSEDENDAAEDYEIWIRMLNNDIKFANLSEILLFYRISANQHTKTYDDNIYESKSKILIKGLELLFGARLTQEIIDTHLSLVVGTGKLRYLFNLIKYHQHLQLLKSTNAKNKVFHTGDFNHIVNQYSLSSKIQQRINKYIRLMLK